LGWWDVCSPREGLARRRTGRGHLVAVELAHLAQATDQQRQAGERNGQAGEPRNHLQEGEAPAHGAHHFEGVPEAVEQDGDHEGAHHGAVEDEVREMIDRLLEAHVRVLPTARGLAAETAANADYGTNDLLVSQVLRTNEFQAWLLAEHVVATPAGFTRQTVESRARAANRRADHRRR